MIQADCREKCDKMRYQDVDMIISFAFFSYMNIIPTPEV